MTKRKTKSKPKSRPAVKRIARRIRVAQQLEQVRRQFATAIALPFNEWK